MEYLWLYITSFCLSYEKKRKIEDCFFEKRHTPVGTGSAASCCFSRNSQMRTLPSSEHEINCLSEKKISDKKKTEHHGGPMLNLQWKKSEEPSNAFIQLVAGTDKNHNFNIALQCRVKALFRKGTHCIVTLTHCIVIYISPPFFKMHSGKQGMNILSSPLPSSHYISSQGASHSESILHRK